MNRRRGRVRVLVLALGVGLAALGAVLAVSGGAGPASRAGPTVPVPQGGGPALASPTPASPRDAELGIGSRRQGVAPGSGTGEARAVPQLTRSTEGGVAVTLTGHVVDGGGRGLGGAWLVDLGREDLARLATADDEGRLVTRVELLDERGNGSSVMIGAPGCTAVERRVPLAEGAEVRLGRVVLEPGLEVRGRVTLSTGEPAAGARIRHSEEPIPADPSAREFRYSVRSVPVALSGSDGTFRLEGLPRADVTLVAWRAGSAEALARVAGAGHAEVEGVELRLGARDGPPTIAGRVLLPDGRPAAGARVRSRSQGRFSWSRVERRTDAEGGFVVYTGRDVPHELEVWPPDGVEARAARAVAEPGTSGLVIRLGPAVWLEVAVTNGAGEPLRGSEVTLLDGDRYPLGDAGRAKVPLPLSSFWVGASAPGYRGRQVGPLEPSACEETGEALVLVLEPGAALRGRVVAAGRPVPGARVTLGAVVEEGSRVERHLTRVEHPFLFRSTFPPARDASCDADGRFLLSVTRAGTCPVLVRAPGFPPTVLGPFDVAWSWTTEVELELRPGGALEGRVLLPEGQSPEGTLVGACPGWGVVTTAPVAADGTYRLDGLAPGPYQVRACVPPVAAFQLLEDTGQLREGVAGVPDVEVRESSTTRFDLDLRELGSVVLEGRVPPCAGGRTELLLVPWDARSPRGPEDLSADAFAVARAWLEQDGSFRMEVSTAGRHELRVSADLGRTGIGADLHLRRGGNAWSFDFEAGSLLLRAEEPRLLRGRLATVRWEDPARGLRWTTERSSRESGGELLLEGLPPGVHHLTISEEDWDGAAKEALEAGEVEPGVEIEWAPRWVPVLEREVEVVAGRETVVELGKPEED